MLLVSYDLDFFFFKQKTAYEMRIRDWSSDVCSSDLFPGAQVTGHDGATINSTLANAARPTLILMNPPFSRSVGLGADAHAAVRHLQEIGRASCRERVCQYV